MTLPPRARLPLLAAGAAALWWGVWLGLSRMGAVPAAAGTGAHGPLMVSGFLGTVISLERAVASRRPWAYVGPLACAASVVLALVAPGPASAWAQALGGAVTLAVLLDVTRRDPALHHVAGAVAAACWVAGTLLLVSGRPAAEAVPLWLTFLVGTICAERLELTRLLPRTRWARSAFVLAGLALMFGAALALVDRRAGLALHGAAQLGFAVWLWRYDLARRTVHEQGATRFIAAALLSGYAWLAVGGSLALMAGAHVAGPLYDAMLHATLVGFVFSMIFGHALIIVPALLGVRLTFSRRFYVHLALLHASLALRVGADLAGSTGLRQAGGWLNAAAIALFLVSTVSAVRRASGARSHAQVGAAPTAPS